MAHSCLGLHQFFKRLQSTARWREHTLQHPTPQPVLSFSRWVSGAVRVQCPRQSLSFIPRLGGAWHGISRRSIARASETESGGDVECPCVVAGDAEIVAESRQMYGEGAEGDWAAAWER